MADDVNPYVNCLKCQPSTSSTSWTPGCCHSQFSPTHIVTATVIVKASSLAIAERPRCRVGQFCEYWV